MAPSTAEIPGHGSQSVTQRRSEKMCNFTRKYVVKMCLLLIDKAVNMKMTPALLEFVSVMFFSFRKRAQ